jgi:aspartokinase/homoserine dehydrogenase 1
MPTRPARPEIHKFGGAALGDAPAIRAVVTLVGRQTGPRVIVVSALAGITDLLLDLLDRAESGDAAAAADAASRFRERHRRVATELLPLAPRRKVMAAIEAAADELVALARSLAVLREASPRVRDHVLGHGERLSARIVVAALAARRIRAHVIDPATTLVTDGPYGDAAPNHAATRRAARGTITPVLLRGEVAVVPGFIGRAPDGGAATLGRGGSDLTATTLARALDARSVTLWKDVPGLLTADPRMVPDARLLPRVHPSEAAELAYYGAKVLHPRALLPLAGRRTPLRVRPFADPEAAGTEISTRREPNAPPVRSLTAISSEALITVAGSGILGVPGMSARTFGALQEAGISVSLIAQASSEHTIDFTVPARHAERAVQVLRRTFRDEIAQGEIEEVRTRSTVAIIAVVGLRMAGFPGIAARVFEALEAADVNVIAIAQGSAEHNISIVVREADVQAALRQIHAVFQLAKAGGGRPRPATGKDVILVGAGTIGRAVLRLLAEHPARFRALRIVAVVDRRGLLRDLGGLGSDRLLEIVKAKEAGRALSTLPGGEPATPEVALGMLGDHALIRPVVVDLTADDTTELLIRAASRGADIVLANKRPLTGTWPRHAALLDALATHGNQLRHEATVGAGLPVVLAVRQLIATGDRIVRLEGALSGTLGHVLTALEDGVPFSAAVDAARRAGMTEPDPRDDLSGMDVARKALILARLLGQRRELADVQMSSLLRGPRQGSVQRWVRELPRQDAWWRDRVARARDAGGVLRFVATITPAAVTTGLQVVSPSHPLGELRGSANRLVITSRRYHEMPMVITGPGAGPDVTATGVLADLLALTGVG